MCPFDIEDAVKKACTRTRGCSLLHLLLHLPVSFLGLFRFDLPFAMSASTDSGSFIFVDDRDTSSINYETPSLWFATSDQQAADGTVTAGISGAKASFSFTGSAIAVLGVASTVQDSTPPTVQFALDGVTVQSTTAPNNGSIDFSFPYLVLDSIKGGQHTLEMAVTDATQEYPFALDLILYAASNGATPTASQSVVNTFLPAVTVTGQPTSGASGSKSAPVGPIVGGVIGGIAVLVGVGVAIWLFCFRKRNRNGQAYFYATSAKPDELLDDEEAKPTPYEIPPQSVAPSSTLGPGSAYSAALPPQSAYTASSAHSGHSGHHSQQAPYAPSEAPISEYGAGSSSVSGPSHPPSLFVVTNPERQTNSPNQPGRSKAAEAGLLSVPQQATYHADSGVRFDENGRPQPVAGGSSSSNVLDANDISDVPPDSQARVRSFTPLPSSFERLAELYRHRWARMTTVNVDSANTTAIEYDSYGSSQWTLVQTSNNGAIFAQTLTKVEGSGGAVYRFHGTSVQVYGSIAVPTVSGATVVSLYALDGGNVTPFSSTQVPDTRVNEADGQLFFDSGTLADSAHVLVINVTIASSAAPYLLDYIKVVETTPPASSISTTATTSGTSSPTSAPSAGSSKSNVGPIVGGVVGGVGGLLLVTAAIFLYVRYFRHRATLGRRRKGGKDLVDDLVDEPKTDMDSSAPFMSGDLWRSTSPLQVPPNAPYAESTLAPSDSASQVAGRLYAAELAAQQRLGQPIRTGPSSQTGPASGSQPGPDTGSGFDPSSAGVARLRPDRKGPAPPPVLEEPEEEAVQHQDSGIRFRDGELLAPEFTEAHGAPRPYGGEGEVERPPEYDDARS
ncbi:hypothetical protein BD309DRAFT_1011845 [Dichomitus squalens]|uniref:Uncharacterized protein n=2 Tax=Dichomitus squalens TaxID=114155 RepID=A0A4Q9NGT5_9APHY|nr:hypothetical protein BD309DRAFT_1011845 [Dichomitus squalens]TBU63136.1 hypothetical protein BD310DRAFT_964892 [Dichomitus squalens]